jgi:hypothetical protein
MDGLEFKNPRKTHIFSDSRQELKIIVISLLTAKSTVVYKTVCSWFIATPKRSSDKP